MAHTYNYAILQLVPFAYREEVVNIGIVVVQPDSVDVRVNASPQLSSYFGISNTTLDWIATGISDRDDPTAPTSDRLLGMSSLPGIRLSELGWFLAENQTQYEKRIAKISEEYVEKPAAARPLRKKSTSVTRDLKKIFREYGLYGARPDDIDKHKIVSNMPVGPSGKLHVDFLLKNSVYHATETIDFRNSQDVNVAEIKNAALVSVTFQHARDFLGEQTKCYLVFAAGSLVERTMKPAIEIAQREVTDAFNLESFQDKARYVDTILNAAGTNGLPV